MSPKSYDAMLDSEWKSDMDEEMTALHANKTLELTSLPPRKQTVSCQWIYIIKFLPNRQIVRFKAWLVVKNYTQTYGVDYLRLSLQ